MSTLIGYYQSHPARPLLRARGQPPSGFQKAAAKALGSGVCILTWHSKQNVGHAIFWIPAYPSSFHGNRSAAQVVVAMTANTGVGWAFIPSSRRNLAHKKSDTVSHVGCSA